MTIFLIIIDIAREAIEASCTNFVIWTNDYTANLSASVF